MKKKKLKPISNTVVNVKTQKEYDELMELCEAAKWEWCSERKPTDPRHWVINENETCIDITKTTMLSFGSKAFYEGNGYKIITFKEFFKAQGLT